MNYQVLAGLSLLAGWSKDEEINTSRILGPCRENRTHRGVETVM